MSFIDYTYFNDDINLTGAQATNITSWITIYEEEILKSLLGYTLYTELIDDLDVNGNPQTTKFINLVGGAEFTFETREGYTVSTKWMGFRDSVRLKSLIAYYVYYQYRNEKESFNTNAGQKVNVSENSERASVIYKLVNTWNKMINLYGITPKGYEPEYFLNLDNYEHYNILPSAYNYLLANKDDFSTWIFNPLRKQNSLGI